MINSQSIQLASILQNKSNYLKYYSTEYICDSLREFGFNLEQFNQKYEKNIEIKQIIVETNKETL